MITFKVIVPFLLNFYNFLYLILEQLFYYLVNYCQDFNKIKRDFSILHLHELH